MKCAGLDDEPDAFCGNEVDGEVLCEACSAEKRAVLQRISEIRAQKEKQFAALGERTTWAPQRTMYRVVLPEKQK